MGRFFRNLALLLLIGSVVLGISSPLLLLTSDASWLNRIYAFLIITLPLLVISGLFYGISNIINLLIRIESRL